MLTTSDLWRGRQIQAGKSTSLLHINDKKFSPLIQNSIANVNMEICYCSMYKDCWIKQSGFEPRQVEKCDVEAPDFFG